MTNDQNDWGLPLNQYANLNNDKLNPPFDSDLDLDCYIESIRLGIQQIHIYNHSSCRDTSQVSISTLRSLSRAYLHPVTLRHMASPSLVSGCIKLASMVKPNGQSSLFSYEYGYLSFTILVISISACLLQRWASLNKTFTMVHLSSRDILEELAQEVSGLIRQRLTSGNCLDGERIDQILGWNNNSNALQHPPLISNSEASAMVTLLWLDRKAFLYALSVTRMPSVVGLMLPLWRHCYIEHSTRSAEGQNLALEFHEILWRYNCGTNWLRVEEWVVNLFDIGMEGGLQTMKKVEQRHTADLEDSRRIILAFINQVYPIQITLDRNKLAGASQASILFRFVYSFVQPGTQDLFPSLFEAIIECFWRDLQFRLTGEEELILSLLTVVSNFK
ncbi:hypothetical protein RSOL_306860 [Rhizoctonia solani AG-3 Rhs1AP]|uniref:Uncharacterized protein n=1 Tax=Rhizoctonia solani AG-3 Rhs1AP TaxID=1086054 RepID=A0A0A1ULI6_9AGAM|nr:hypothetical protein RSOL_306860 [Rhizoctonia solani AG-3 Rhs1AP]